VKKSLFFAAALVAVAVFGASACSYSEEAEPGVRNFSLETKTERAMVHLSSDCERDSYDRAASFGCFTVYEQQRIAGLLNSVLMLTKWDETVSYDHFREDGTKLLKLLMDFEALEVLCYSQVYNWMFEEPVWPFVEIRTGEGTFDNFPLGLLDQLWLIRVSIDSGLSRIGVGASVSSMLAETPVLETVRYRHLCPSWMYE